MYAPLVSLMITVPVFGQHEYTHALVADLEREGADYLIVDNRGDYPRIGTERVSTPGENLGWAGGSELGFRLAFAEGYSHAMTLNNDTRVSKDLLPRCSTRGYRPTPEWSGRCLTWVFPSR